MHVRTHTNTQTHTRTHFGRVPLRAAPVWWQMVNAPLILSLLLLGYLASFTGPSLRCLSSLWP